MTSMFSVLMSWTATLSVLPVWAAPPAAVLDAGAVDAGALVAAELAGAAVDAAPLDGGVLDAGAPADWHEPRRAKTLPEASNFKAVRRVIPPLTLDRPLSMSIHSLSCLG